MRPEQRSNRLLGVTRSKAKMIEYHVPEQYQDIDLSTNPDRLFTISIGLLGDLAATINRNGTDPDTHAELRNNLLFSARFFDSFLQSKLDETLDSYLILLGSASFYLCDLPGSASVLAKRNNGNWPDLGGEGLESLLLWMLQADLGTLFDKTEGTFGGYIDGISKGIHQFFMDGIDDEKLINLVTDLRADAYKFGSPRQLLFSDVIGAVLRKKLENSTWRALPLYSGLSRDKWLHALKKESFIRELWPAQHLLGKADVLKGKSAIVQMPTSAGKTKATELILRSAFLADRVTLAIIIAPFRALCHEIKNSLVDAFRNETTKVDELSDALQTDFDIAELLGHQQILVITPEKLLYVLRHAPELASHVGILVFDEGHQFDNGTRGITYELLLTSLRSMLPKGAQKVLISAVIRNAEALGEWLNGEPYVVEGTTLNPTFRSVGFASWLDRLGRIEFVDSRDAEQEEFFVPRVIERIELERKKGESLTKAKYFPNPSEGKEIAIYLGLKLVSGGAVAIFCGRKDTVSGLCELVTERFSRNLPLVAPLKFSNQQEVKHLTHLYGENLGAEVPASQSAALGIFSHHGNTPHGIRLAVEYAMRENLVRFVVCTSTLAQGVNLPIRYLIFTGIYQGMDQIKVRDFHNLIGRAGRAGMHTEGSILFADPDVYDKRRSKEKGWRWKRVKELLDPHNSEPCISNLLSIFEPIKSDDGKYTIKMEALDFARAYINNPDEISNLAAEISKQHGDKGFKRDSIERQIVWRINLICAIESFLLSHWDETENGLSEMDVILLAEGTLAFFLANDQQKEHIRELFKLLAENISTTIIEPARRKVYGRTLYGVNDAQAIEEWVQLNAADLLSIGNEAEVLNLLWPLFTRQIISGIFTKFDKPEVLKEIAQSWIDGIPFYNILKVIHERKAKMIWGSQRREFKIDHVVEVCEHALAFDGALLVGAMCEFIEMLDQEGTSDLINRLQIFQKRLKYGLPTETTIALYELGFSDRVISQDIVASMSLSATRKKDLVKSLKNDRDTAIAVIEKYPSYFQERMKELL